MKKINYIIVEDEPRARKTLALMMEESFPDIELKAEFDKVSLAAVYLKENKVDFIFLDVQLNGEIGLDLVNYINKDQFNFEIIFTTAHSGFALEAFSLSAIDYILKPIYPERLRESVNRVLRKQQLELEQLKILQQISTTDKIDKLVIKNLDGNHILFTKDILYLKADNVYTEFYTSNGRQYVASKPLKEYEILLTQSEFYKSHRSYILNTHYIEAYHKSSGTITLKGGKEIKLSKEKIKEFEQLFKLK